MQSIKEELRSAALATEIDIPLSIWFLMWDYLAISKLSDGMEYDREQCSK